MDNIDKIVYRMPRITPAQIRKHILSVRMGLNIAEDECRLLAEQGYRKVPSGGEIEAKLLSIPEEGVGVGEELHRWLLEGDSK